MSREHVAGVALLLMFCWMVLATIAAVSMQPRAAVFAGISVELWLAVYLLMQVRL